MFSAEALERAITEILKERLPIAESTEIKGLAEEARLRDPLLDSCKTYTTPNLTRDMTLSVLTLFVALSVL